jgi:hypothetical protein
LCLFIRCNLGDIDQLQIEQNANQPNQGFPAGQCGQKWLEAIGGQFGIKLKKESNIWNVGLAQFFWIYLWDGITINTLIQ